MITKAKAVQGLIESLIKFWLLFCSFGCGSFPSHGHPFSETKTDFSSRHDLWFSNRGPHIHHSPHDWRSSLCRYLPCLEFWFNTLCSDPLKFIKFNLFILGTVGMATLAFTHGCDIPSVVAHFKTTYPLLVPVAKLAVAFPLSFHATAGLRHLVCFFA
jgi:hypothetical protein